MKRLILLFGVLGLIVLSGCREKYYSPSTEDYMREIYECEGKSGYYHHDRDCLQYKKEEGCIHLTSIQRIEIVNLPIGYENITDRYYGKEFHIIPFCTNSVIKEENKTCEETCKSLINSFTNEPFECTFSYYRIDVNYKQNITLCWE